MFDIDAVTDQIRRNSDISDARNAGLYSICGLALRLRDLYKWEHRLPPWEERDSSQILDWIAERETRWEGLLETDYRPLSIDGRSHDPFDTAGINAVLAPHGLFYGAGYAHGLKPTFLLACIDETRSVEGFTVHCLGRELVRDLLTLPAFTQDGGILLRQEAANLYLWDKMFYINNSGRRALAFALKHCGLPDAASETQRRHLPAVFAAYRDTCIRHEVGELNDTVFDRGLWQELIGAYPHTSVELIARSLKDLLADTNELGTLPDIVRRRNAAALGLYTAFFDGLAREFFPELRVAFDLFAAAGDWSLIDEAVAAGRRRAVDHTRTVTDLYLHGKQTGEAERAREEIVRCLLGRSCAAAAAS
jgi:hypothetical protein